MFKNLKKRFFKFAMASVTLSLPISSSLVCKASRFEDAIIILKRHGYTVKEEDFLGEGAFNIVFKAINPNGETVAVKIVVSDEKTMKQETEAVLELHSLRDKLETSSGENSLELKHFRKYCHLPKIVSSGVYTIPESYYYLNGRKYCNRAQEYHYAIFEDILAKHDLLRMARGDSQYGNVDFLKMLKITKDTLKALEAFHRAGRVHFDLKPENMVEIISKDGKSCFKVIDCGLMINTETVQSKFDDEFQYEMKIRGTKSYIAPEQDLQSNEIQLRNIKKIDVYKAGISFLTIYGYLKFGIIPMEEEGYERRIPIGELIDLIYNKPNSFYSDDEYKFLMFCKSLIDEDPTKRPTASEALVNPLFSKRNVEEPFSYCLYNMLENIIYNTH